MLKTLFSNDFPRSPVLNVLLVGILLVLLFLPFISTGAVSLNAAARICIFVVLVASYDLLLGYTGIVSFAHTMFFGIGAYGVAISMTMLGPTWGSLLVGAGAAIVVSMVLALVIGLFSLRVKAIFFAMITLAVASAFATLASQLSDITGGEDGLNFKVPELLRPSYQLFESPIFGLTIDGKIITYYLVFFTALFLFLVMLRIVNSPFGRVLLAIRENDFRAEALGYRTVVYRTLSNVFSAGFATLAGVLLAVWLRYNGPDSTLSFEIMMDILLMVVIGGMGTMYGAVFGATIFIIMQNYLQLLMKMASTATSSVPFLSNLLNPDRWLLWLGVMFVLSVYYFPTGIVGKLRAFALKSKS